MALGLALPAGAQQGQMLQQTTPMPNGRAFHSTAVLRDYLYVFGGSIYENEQATQTATNSVLVAKIGANGQVSQWVPTTPLPESRHYIGNSTIVLNDTVYILGGSTAVAEGERLGTVIWAKPGANGMLSPWQASAPFDGALVSCLAAFSTPGHLWMTGGLPKGAPTSDRVYSVAVNADGSLGKWEESYPLPTPLWFHHAGVVGGRVYIWGGLKIADDNKSVSDGVFSAQILGSGKLSQWVEEGVKLPQGFYGGSSANAGPYLFSFSPRYGGGGGTNDAWWTTITWQGMRPWQKTPTALPMKLYHAAAADYRRGSIYFVGGKEDTKGPGFNPVPWSVFFKLSESARQQAEQGWMAAQAAHLSASTGGGTAEPAAAPGGGAASATAAPAAPTGFQPYEQARASVAGKKPMIVYYRMEGAKPCLEQDRLLADPQFQELAKKQVFALADIKSSPQVAQQFGVFRSPTWIFYDGLGNERGRNVGVIQLTDLAMKAGALK
jgi:N-acetylneuraminic acid mutarotase